MQHHDKSFVELICVDLYRLLDLRNEVLISFDGTCNLRREVAGENCEVDQVLDGLLAFVDLDYVVKKLEREKRNAKGENYIYAGFGVRYVRPIEGCKPVLQKEVGIFEVDKSQNVSDNTSDQNYLLERPSGARDRESEQPVHEGHGHNEDEIYRFPKTIKNVAGDQQQSRPKPRRNAPIEQ